MFNDRPAVIEVKPAPHGLSVRLEGSLLVPRLITKSGRSCTVALVAGGAMLLPGDRVDLRISVGPGCSLELIDVGGLVVHGRPDDDQPGFWQATIAVDDQARLQWNALPTVITDEGRLARSTQIVLAAGAVAVVRETVVFGRVGELGGALEALTRVVDRQGPVLVEQLVASGRARRPGIMGEHRLMDTVLYLGEDAVIPEVRGVTRLDFDRAGGMHRWLGQQAHLSPLQQAMPS